MPSKSNVMKEAWRSPFQTVLATTQLPMRRVLPRRAYAVVPANQVGQTVRHADQAKRCGNCGFGRLSPLAYHPPMGHLHRWAFNGAAMLSAVSCVVTCWLWVASHSSSITRIREFHWQGDLWVIECDNSQVRLRDDTQHVLRLEQRIRAENSRTVSLNPADVQCKAPPAEPLLSLARVFPDAPVEFAVPRTSTR